MLHPTRGGAHPHPKLSAQLHQLAGRFSEQRVSLGEVMAVLGVRASGLLIIILALPFCAPIGILGLSIPFGLVILFIAARFTLGLPPWLPARLLALRLPPRFFHAMLEGASRLVGWIERRIRPRWPWWTETRGRLRLHAALVGFSGFLLLLPLGGIPFTNTLPALVIVVGMLGMMERDGAAIALAYGLFAFTLAYFGFFATVMIGLLQRFMHWLAAM